MKQLPLENQNSINASRFQNCFRATFEWDILNFKCLHIRANLPDPFVLFVSLKILYR